MEEQVLVKLPNDANLQLPSVYLLNLYKDFEDRVLWIEDDIDNDSIDYIKMILRWNREDFGKVEKKPIKIFFFSNGGSLDVQEMLSATIEISKTPIIGIAMGCVASAAALIYMSCHKRLTLPNAYFILHKGSCSGISGNYADVQNAMEMYREQVEKMVSSILRHTNYDEEIARKKIEHDWYVQVPEAIENGLTHKVIDNIEDLL